MSCACFVHNCKTEAVRPEHTHCSADVVGLPRRSLCQGVKSRNRHHSDATTRLPRTINPSGEQLDTRAYNRGRQEI